MPKYQPTCNNDDIPERDMLYSLPKCINELAKNYHTCRANDDKFLGVCDEGQLKAYTRTWYPLGSPKRGNLTVPCQAVGMALSNITGLCGNRGGKLIATSYLSMLRYGLLTVF
ncbi:hypothetical protein BT63DRAFT_426716 [Microthyrium microscopicum]|uniref:Uncharacterized protein n=1 Tax=Microthyrium microscopicum TaxID=703497 RepID=A0A6A6U981_9PEZI|nr:hypothetical protein BT63DRAFT_426716 [Microthyrium microscopicum]